LIGDVGASCSPGAPISVDRIHRFAVHLAEIYTGTVTPAAAPQYAREVLDDAYRRAVGLYGTRMTQLAENGVPRGELTDHLTAMRAANQEILVTAAPRAAASLRVCRSCGRRFDRVPIDVSLGRLRPPSAPHPCRRAPSGVLMRKLLLPQYFPGPRQFRQAAVTDQLAGGVPERLACRWPPKLEIVQGGA
jgi:hypothetical protein